MILKRSLCLVSSIGMMMVMLPTATIYAEESNYYYTDHNTYIDVTTCTEYNLDGTQITDLDHLLNCKFYQEVYASWSQNQQTEEKQTTEEETKTTEEKQDIDTDANKEEKVDDTKEESKDTTTTEESKDSTTTKESKDSTKTEESKETDKVEESKDTEKTEESKEETKSEETLKEATQNAINNYVEDTWYHPTTVLDNGYVGEVKKAIKEDNFITNNWNKFKEDKNPFTIGECTYFAWSRFYQIYGYDSGARGNGKTNAAEIVKAHPDKFELSSTPAAGATFSIEKNSTYPQYGHVGFVEAFDGTYLYISEGNVEINGSKGNIWIHKVKWEDYKKQYPDITFAVPKENSNDANLVLKLKLPTVTDRKFSIG